MLESPSVASGSSGQGSKHGPNEKYVRQSFPSAKRRTYFALLPEPVMFAVTTSF